MKQLFAILTATLALTGCATVPKQSAVPTPTYFEKARAVGVASVRATCADLPGADADHHALVPLANACVKAEQWTRVEAFGQRLATRAPRAPWGAYYLALAAEARGDVARAHWMIELALKKAPDQALLHFELARIFAATKDDAGVIKAMKTAAALDPELTAAHLFNGQLALRRGDLGEAKRELAQALKSEPAQPTALLALAQAQLQSNEYAGAEDTLARAIKANPRHAGARLALAQIQETHLKKFEDALQTLKELRQLSADRQIDGAAPRGLSERIQNLEKTVSQAKLTDEKSTRMPSAERK